MDKYEFKLSLEEINKLIAQRRYDEAADIADGIDWNHVGNADTLRRISEVYKAVGDYDRSRSVMAIARKRQPDNPAIIYSLCELTIYLYGRDGLQDDLTDSLQMMQEYQALQPDNPKRLVLQYRMYGVSGASVSEKIAVLEQLKKENFTARWGYELAKCYAEAGEQGPAAELAVEVSEIFGGRYGDRARALAQSLKETSGRPEGAQEGTAPGQPGSVPAAEPAHAAAPQEEETPAADRPVGEAVPGSQGDEEAAAWVGRVRTERQAPEPSEQEFSSEEIPEDSGSEGEPDGQTGRQASIDEVMAEWEKIRSDIRRANDEKRAQRILEDTGSLLNSFDETARHGLLEDIERGVARQRRQVRSGVYRVSRESYEEEAAEPDRPQGRDPYGDRYDGRDAERYDADPGVKDEAYDERPARRYEDEAYDERPARRYEDEVYDERPARRYEDEAYDERPARRYEDEVHDERPVRRYEDEAYDERPARRSAEESDQEPAGQEEEQVVRRAVRPKESEEPAGGEYAGDGEAVSSPRREDAVPVSNEEDDVRIYGREEVDDARTRRWNSEEIHRAVARGTRYREDARGRKRVVVIQDDEEEPGAEGEDAGYIDTPPAEQPAPRAVQEPESPEETEGERQEEPEKEPAAAREEEEVSRPHRGRVRRMNAGEEPYGPLDDGAEPVQQEKPAAQAPREPAPELKEPAHAQEEPQKEPEDQSRPDPAVGAAGEEKTPSGKRELTREERRLFGPFCRMTENVNQLTEALDQISLSSTTGNLLILGNEATADRVARGILEIVRHSDSNFTGRIARATGESLNKLDARGFARTFEKLESGALIVTRAADIAPKTLERMHTELEREHGVILILTDSNKRMEQFRKENGQYLESFTALINIRPLDDKALVAYARDYALSQDYSIDEFGQLALAQRISSMQTPTHHVTLKEVRDLVDEAISYASRKNPGTMMEVLSRKRRDEDKRIILHEKDFTHY